MQIITICIDQVEITNHVDLSDEIFDALKSTSQLHSGPNSTSISGSGALTQWYVIHGNVLLVFNLITSRISLLLNLCLIHQIARVNNKAPELLEIICSILAQQTLSYSPGSREYLTDVATLIVDSIPEDQRVVSIKPDILRSSIPAISNLLGSNLTQNHDLWLGLASQQLLTPSSQSQQQPQPHARAGATRPPTTPISSQQSISTPRPLLGHHKTASLPQNKAPSTILPYSLKPWEMLPDQGNSASANDTAISLMLFNARKV
jgi:hypothetical protein